MNITLPQALAPGLSPTAAPGLSPTAVPGLSPTAVPGLSPTEPFRSAERARLLDQRLARVVVADVLVAFDAPDSLRLRAAAASLLLTRPSGGDPGWVVGFGSAAWLHLGSLAAGTTPARLDIILAAGGRRPRSDQLRSRQVVLPREVVTEVYGVAVTDPLRTAADVARDLPAEQALVVLRHLGEMAGVRPHRVLQVLAGLRYGRGTAQGRRVVQRWLEER